MKSIARIILRGLLSGEIKPEPKVFDLLKDLTQSDSNAEWTIAPRQSGGGAALKPEPAPSSCPSGTAQSRSLRFTPPTQRTPRSGSPNASLTGGSPFPSRRIQPIGCLLALGLVLTLGLSQAVADPNLPEAVSTSFTVHEPVSEASITGTSPIALTWVWGIASALALTVMLYAGWLWLCRSKLFVMLPYEAALQELDEAWRIADRHESLAYCSTVLCIVRRYIEQQFNIRAPLLTTQEFLQVLTRPDEPLLRDRNEMLAELVCSIDDAMGSEKTTARHGLEAVKSTATRFVWATACDASSKSRRTSLPTTLVAPSHVMQSA